MQINPSIALSGQQPNILAAFSGGQEMAQQQIGRQNENALNGYIQQNAGGIMGGDQNALAGMAGLGTQGLNAAMGVQGAQLDMQNTQSTMQDREARLKLAYDQAAQQAQMEAAQMSAAERQAEAAQLERGLAMGTQAQSPEQWDQVMQSLGLSDMVGQFEQRDMIIAGALGIKDALSMGQEDAPTPQSAIAKLQSDLSQGLINQEQYDLALQNMAPTGMTIESTPGGGFRMVQGAGVGADDGRISPSDPSQMIAAIDGVLNDPALETATGVLAWTQAIPGTDARRFGARARQIEGQAFLQAFESLKGGGQITEIEGLKATQAIGRLDTAQRPEDYRQALTELREILTAAQERAAAPATPAPAGVDPALFEFMTPEEKALFQ